MQQDVMANRKMIEELYEEMEKKDRQIRMLTECIEIMVSDLRDTGGYGMFRDKNIDGRINMLDILQ